MLGGWRVGGIWALNGQTAGTVHACAQESG